MIPEQVTVKDIAAATNKTVQWIRMMADERSWPNVIINNRGDRRYEIDQLPPDIREAVLTHQVIQSYSTASSEPLPVPAVPVAVAKVERTHLPAPSTLTEYQRSVMDARIVILNFVDGMAKATNIDQAQTKAEMMAKSETLPAHIQALISVANDRSNGNPKKLSKRTLQRWRAKRLEGGTTALAPIDQTPQIPEWASYLLKVYRQPQKPSVADAYEMLLAILPPEILRPSLSQCRRFLAKMSTADLAKGRCTGNALRSQLPFRRRSTEEIQPLDWVTCDGHTFKAAVAHPDHGRPFHPEVCAVLDAATRKAIGWSAGLSESASTVADALRHAIIQAGIPLYFYTDPGSGNTANINAHPSYGRYSRLDIEFKTGIPGNTQARGMIERFQKSCWIRAAKLLSTYTGKDMDGTVLYKKTRLLESDIRKHGRSDELMGWRDFLRFLVAAIDAYNNRPHSALPKIMDESGRKRHMTPNECWNWWLSNGWQPESISDEELADMWRPQVTGRVIRGEVRLFGNIYYHGDLKHYNRQDVIKEYEPQDPNYVWVRDLNGVLICKAKWNGNKSSVYPVSAIEAQREKRAEGRRKRVEKKLEEIELERRGSMVIDVQPDPKAIEARRQIEETMQLQLAESNEPKFPENIKGKWQKWNHYDRIKKAGAELSEKEESFYQAFQTTPEWRAFSDMEHVLGGGDEPRD